MAAQEAQVQRQAEARRQAESQQRLAEERLKKYSLSFNKLQFVEDRESGDITVKVIDPDTDKVIKVLPPEELRRLGNGIDEGLFLDKTA